MELLKQQQLEEARRRQQAYENEVRLQAEKKRQMEIEHQNNLRRINEERIR
jgi:hypothetical protein